jgi:hypothetical protein
MPGPVLGDFLQIARISLNEAEAVPGPASSGASARQLARIAAILPRYLDVALPHSGPDRPLPDNPEPPGLEGCTALREALHLAAQNLAGLEEDRAPAREPAASDTQAALLSRAADALAAGHDLLRTHIRTGPDGSPAERSWWAGVLHSPAVSATLAGEVAELSRRTARQAAHIAWNCPDKTVASTLDAARSWLQRGEESFSTSRQAAPFSIADRELARSIPAARPPERAAPAPGETDTELCRGILASSERLSAAGPAGVEDARWSPAANSDAWKYTASAAAIACDLARQITGLLALRARWHSLYLRAAPALRTAAEAAGQAHQAWRHAARAWDSAHTDGPSVHTPAMTDASDLVLRLGRLAFTQPGWTPAGGPKAELRNPFKLAADGDAVSTVLAAVHFTASALTAMADSDAATISTAGGAGRLRVLTRTLPASSEIRGRYTPAPPGRIDGITAAYHLARDATETLARQLDVLALQYGAPSTVLARARAARRITLPPSLTASTAAGYPRRQGAVESQVRRTGTSDPGLLLHAAAIDSAARAVLAQAAQDATHVTPSPTHLPAATRAAVQNGHAQASSARGPGASPPQNAAPRGSAPARDRTRE